jgi:hypothetical protein
MAAPTIASPRGCHPSWLKVMAQGVLAGCERYSTPLFTFRRLAERSWPPDSLAYEGRASVTFYTTLDL